MGDRVAVMSMGVLQQVDRPQAPVRRAVEPLRRELHRDAADEPLLREGPGRGRGDLRRDRPGIALRWCRLPAPLSARSRRWRAKGVVVGVARRGPPPGRCRGPTCRRSTRRSSSSRRSAPASMVYFHIDADPVRPPGTHGRRRRRTTATRGSPDAPNLIAHFPPRVELRLGSRRPRRGGPGQPPLLRRGDGCGASLAARSLPSIAIALGASGAGAVADQARPPTGAELERLAQPATYSPFASQRIYFVLPDRYANGDPSNDQGGKTGGRSVTGYDPVDPGWFHGGDLAGLTGGCTDTKHGLARLVDLGFTAHLDRAGRRAADGAGRQRRVPRLLGPRLHAGRPAPRLERGLRRLRRLRAPARAQGLPRRRREPHGGRDPARRRIDVPGRRRGALPRLQGQAVLGAAARGEALPVPLSALPAAAAARPSAEPGG